ncbi:DUF2975 domain-containing protein [Streptomyces sp. NPDC052225]|uniref:DUF2975 domain-containing protein n=1 Tax=Streptomyces sp. NPDC052225 TaxID=3154949 RepID=UPI00341420B4
MGKLTMLALRAVIVALLAGSVVVQTVMVPLFGHDLNGLDGDAANLPRVPILLILLLGIVCAEIVLVCVWQLVTKVRRGTVVSPAAFRQVDIVTGAFAAAALLSWTLGFVLAPGEAVAPGVVLLIGGVGLAALGVALVVLVLRMVLAQAVARDREAAHMQAELNEVI